MAGKLYQATGWNIPALVWPGPSGISSLWEMRGFSFACAGVRQLGVAPMPLPVSPTPWLQHEHSFLPVRSCPGARQSANVVSTTTASPSSHLLAAAQVHMEASQPWCSLPLVGSCAHTTARGKRAGEGSAGRSGSSLGAARNWTVPALPRTGVGHGKALQLRGLDWVVPMPDPSTGKNMTTCG